MKLTSKTTLIAAFALILAIGGGFFIFMPKNNEASLQENVANTIENSAADSEESAIEENADLAEESASDISGTAPAELEEEEAEPLEKPAIDVTLLRVDKQGEIVVTGATLPNVNIELIFADGSIAETRSDGAGEFVFLATVPLSEASQELYILNTETGEKSKAFLILGRKAEETPKIVTLDDDTVAILQEEAEEEKPEEPTIALSNEPAALPKALSLQTITYTTTGDVSLGGDAQAGTALRVYLNNKAVDSGFVPEDGEWQMEIPNINEGLYTLRIDQLNERGDVTARVESPFKRETPREDDNRITIQPGATLWQLAEDQYGEGTRFVIIYEANKNLIQNPDLIFPGQIFDLPKQE